MILLITLSIKPISYCQCPENKEELILNTQEKYDYFFKNYPNCGEYNIIMTNGKFRGDPRPIEYLITLILSLGTILILTTILISKLNLG